MASLRLLAFCLPILPLSAAQEPGASSPPPPGQVLEEEPAVKPLSPSDLEAYEELTDLVEVPTEIGARRLGAIDTRPTSLLRALGMRFFPVFSQEFQWDDNVLLEDPGSEDSARLDVTRLGLFTRGAFWGGRGEVDLGYLLRSVHTNADSSTFDDFQEHFGAGSVRVDGSAGFARAGFKLENRTQPVAIQATGPVFAQDERDIRSLYAQVGVFPSAHTLLDVGVDQSEVDHDVRSLSHLDGTQRQFSARAGLRTGAESLVYVKGGVGTWKFDAGPTLALADDDFAFATVGLEWTRLEALEVVAEIGARSDDFDDSGTFEPGDKNTEVVGSVRARAALGPDTRLSGALLRTVAPATASNFQLVNRLDVSLDRLFGDRLRGRGGTFVEQSDPSEQDDSRRVGLGFGLRYELSHNIDFGADYEWRRRDADEPGGDYRDSRLTFGFGLRF
ncbi:MAG TPA: outer membrane beta-barrel protein [Planctomycetota bacterium]|jgi:opacity protein-like surface antigen|nr:outer membrane beta-barrel protein [Planctomycetota bacterium]